MAIDSHQLRRFERGGYLAVRELIPGSELLELKTGMPETPTVRPPGHAAACRCRRRDDDTPIPAARGETNRHCRT